MDVDPADLGVLIAAVEERLDLRVRRWRDLGGSRTTNVALGTRDGSTVVVRLHDRATSPERVAAEQAVRSELSGAGLPTVVPVALERLPDGRLWELEPYVDAPDRMRTPDRLTAGYRLLGRLHDGLRRAVLPPAAVLAPHANHVPARDAVRLTRAGVQRVLGWPGPDLHRYARTVAGHVAAVAALEQPLHRGQLHQLVHGDFWDNNVLFRGDEPQAVLDFGFMGHRARVDDLALPFWFWLLEPGHGLPGPRDLQLLVRLVDAYDSGTDQPLSPDERAALPLAVARQPAWSIGHWVLHLDDDAALAHARSAADELPTAQAVLAALPGWQRALLRPHPGR